MSFNEFVVGKADIQCTYTNTCTLKSKLLEAILHDTRFFCEVVCLMIDCFEYQERMGGLPGEESIFIGIFTSHICGTWSDTSG